MQQPILALLATLVLTLPAWAEIGDGPWTIDELKVVYPDLTPEQFTQIDAWADGSVDQTELDAAIAAGVVAPIEG